MSYFGLGRSHMQCSAQTRNRWGHLSHYPRKKAMVVQDSVFYLANMGQRHVAFCERHAALHERHVALLVFRQ